jgi:hypothetical protein
MHDLDKALGGSKLNISMDAATGGEEAATKPKPKKSAFSRAKAKLKPVAVIPQEQTPHPQNRKMNRR